RSAGSSPRATARRRGRSAAIREILSRERSTLCRLMDVLTPRTLDEALRLKAERPDCVAIQGGTDVMVELNFDRVRPPALLNLNEVEELRGWSRENGTVWLGHGTPGSRQTFLKVGPRNAMVIAVVSLALRVDQELRAAFGSAGPVPTLVRGRLSEVDTFSDRVAEAASPIDDVRGTAAYR